LPCPPPPPHRVHPQSTTARYRVRAVSNPLLFERQNQLILAVEMGAKFGPLTYVICLSISDGQSSWRTAPVRDWTHPTFSPLTSNPPHGHPPPRLSLVSSCPNRKIEGWTWVPTPCIGRHSPTSQGMLGTSLGPMFLSMTPTGVLYSAHTWANDSLLDRPDQGMGLLEPRNGTVRPLRQLWAPEWD
jgi:hypothetical protein